jgi:uncharacterized membrane protein YGL010W
MYLSSHVQRRTAARPKQKCESVWRMPHSRVPLAASPFAPPVFVARNTCVMFVYIIMSGKVTFFSDSRFKLSLVKTVRVYYRLLSVFLTLNIGSLRWSFNSLFVFFATSLDSKRLSSLFSSNSTYFTITSISEYIGNLKL